ncbi:MAG: DUF6174 domain-containing protein [Anaerolineae bacterium]|nr:DUF6174 domain-containing protein [Anaerolineae bacterium]
MRIGSRKLLLLAVLVVIIILILLLPFTLYIYKFKTNLQDNLEKWSNLSSGHYEMVVASNAHTTCTGGWNTVIVEHGKVTKGRNAECDDCTLEDFSHLTVEALFDRIWEECIHHRPWYLPFPVCNVAYDDQLGCPIRLDTYTFTPEGEYLPSITVDSIIFLP